MAGRGGGTTVDCPQCGTTYRLSGLRAAGDTTYECARCHAVFGSDAADDGWRDDPEEDAFRFDDEEPPARAAASARAGRRRKASVPALRMDEDGREDARDDEADDMVLEVDDEEPAAAPAPARRRRRRSADEEADDDEPRSPGVARFALRGLIFVTLTYAVLSVWASTHRNDVQRRLAGIPLIGTHLAESAVASDEVALRDVSGEYDYLKSGELAFVVRGTAVNLGKSPLRRVRVEGRVAGAGERRQVASCTDAPADVRRTSRQMLALMENVRETRPAVVPAGGSAACEVVFVDPPQPVTELSLTVVSVLAD
ncbi:MAG TPA: hypothetical protein VNO26_12395 [Candidatus Limnocylindria bacterium]|nr:hypothetical protein [Candidatus Limnocylindria bacterium]